MTSGFTRKELRLKKSVTDSRTSSTISYRERNHNADSNSGQRDACSEFGSSAEAPAKARWGAPKLARSKTSHAFFIGCFFYLLKTTLLEALYKAGGHYLTLWRLKGDFPQESLQTVVLLTVSSSSSDTHREFGTQTQVLSWHPGPRARLRQAGCGARSVCF